MKPEELYESWKRSRANIEPPADFADRVMTSIHQTRRLAVYLTLQSLTTTLLRSRVAQTSVCSVAIGIWLVRVCALLTILIPR